MFLGLDRAHGRYVLHEGSAGAGQKVDGHGVTIQEPTTLALWEAHLAGKYHLGIVPLLADDTCVWAMIDVDVYDLDLTEVVQRTEGLQLPLVICRSKSGGAHIFLFLSTPEPAKLVRRKMQQFAEALGWPQSEIFPKQIKHDESGTSSGNWLNMPYFGGAASLRYALDPETTAALSPEDFLALAELRSLLPHLIGDLDPVQPTRGAEQENLRFPGGPPCLNTRFDEGKIAGGERNEILFNLGIYYRKLGLDKTKTREHMWEINQHNVARPLPVRDLNRLADSSANKSYNYRCKEPALAACCDRKTCLLREFGINAGGGGGDGKGWGTNGQDLRFGTLIKFATADPIYHWDVNGIQVRFTAKELMSPKLASECIFKAVNIVMRPIKRMEWEAALAQQLIKIQTFHPPPDSNDYGLFRHYLSRFCVQTAQAKAMDEIMAGKPYTDKGRTYFQLTDLMEYMQTNKFAITNDDILYYLHQLGAIGHRSNLKGIAVSYWSLPAFDFPLESSVSKPPSTGEF